MTTCHRHLLVALLTPIWALLAARAQADVLVIASARNPVSALTPKQVVELYMGRSQNFPDGSVAVPLDQLNGSRARREFYLALTGKTEAQIDAFWARLIFAGRITPPEQLPDDEAVLAAVRGDASAIGFISRAELPAGVKPLLVLPAAAGSAP